MDGAAKIMNSGSDFMLYNPFRKIEYLESRIASLQTQINDLRNGSTGPEKPVKHIATGACAGCKNYIAWTQHFKQNCYDYYACRLELSCPDREEYDTGERIR